MSNSEYTDHKESLPAKSVRLMKKAMKKPGGKTYFNAVELQRAERNMKDYRKENIKVVK